ncbi:response regulator transcription factor [Aquibacillus albus]|uniref:YesN/AraC family two-component response regulator n=1 Tax=Aquibacillus albus TaxID=1168171 RepID=A0ABS2MWB4_9BACI|nr:response regulator [Aquibacillus albus]MBM7570078.1 YesN/AraC family two-component response regulator [Aquibacillus albus]
MNIYVIEDEYWALMELKTIFKEFEDSHKVHYFDNGKTAYDQACLEKPDLVVTDITMPEMDGLVLVEKLKEIDQHIECILLTVHDTFDYAKKGIKLGVKDYLLKPVNKLSLIDTINKAIKSIEVQKTQENEHQNWLVKQSIFNPLEKNSKVDDFCECSLHLVYLLLGNWKASVSWSTINNKIEKVQSKLDKDNRLTVFSLDSQRKIILYKENKSIEAFDFKTFIHEISKVQHLHIGYAIKPINRKLCDTYNELHKLMDKNKLFGQSTYFESPTELPDRNIQQLWDSIRLIEKYIRSGEMSLLESAVSNTINEIKKYQLTQKQLVRFLWDVYYAITFKLEDASIESIHMENIDEVFERLDVIVTYEELEKWFCPLILEIANIYKPRNIAPKHLIPAIKNWIEQSYSSNITLQQFAERHHVSISYLSREFKEQTGYTFSEYLARFRCEKAKEYFNKGYNKTVGVGELVGYSDPKHFRSVFKKIIGTTPREYKENHM